MKAKTILWSLLALIVPMTAAGQPHRFQQKDFQTDTPMVHDPVMAYEDSTWHIFATGMGIQHMTSKDRKTWTVKTTPVMSVIPQSRPLVARLQLFHLRTQRLCHRTPLHPFLGLWPLE